MESELGLTQLKLLKKVFEVQYAGLKLFREALARFLF